MPLYLVEGPTERVLSLDMVKSHLKVDHSDEDALIELYSLSAEKALDGRDGWLGRALMAQTWEYRPTFVGSRNARAITLHGMSARGSFIELPLAPLLEVEHVKYYDENNALQTLSTDVYEVVGVGSHNPGKIVLKIGQTWPTMYIKAEPMIITYRAGYVDNSGSPTEGEVPAPIKNALLLMIGDAYANRESTVTGTIVAKLPTVEALLMPYQIQYFG